MGVFAAIDIAFNKAILNGGFGLPVASENVDYDALGVPYLAGYILPAPVIQSSLGVQGCDLHTGIFQIDINFLAEAGVSDMKAKADEINAVFKSGAVFIEGDFTIHLKNTSISRVQVSGGFAKISLTSEFWLHNLRG